MAGLDPARLEFVYMVEAGMSPQEALRSATLEAARVLDLDADLGTVGQASEDRVIE
jgi:imidazolonepropionase-like amidohydrolase